MRSPRAGARELSKVRIAGKAHPLQHLAPGRPEVAFAPLQSRQVGQDALAYAASSKVLLEQRFVRSILAEQLPEPRGIRYDPHLAAGAEGSAPNRSGVA